MHSRLFVYGLPRSLPTLPRSPAPLSCVEGRHRAAPHSSFPPTTAPLQTFHEDVWSPTRVRGQDHKRYFLLDLHVLRLHSNRGGEFSSHLLEEFCRAEGIARSFTLPASPQQNEIAERHIGLIMEGLGLALPCPPYHRWQLSSRTARSVFLGFPIDAPGWEFYHPALRRVLSSHDTTFDESVGFYCLHPHASSPVPLLPLFLVPGPPPPADPLPLKGHAPSGVSQVDPPPLVEPLEVSSDTSSPIEVGEPVANDTAATRRSPHLETPPGFLLRSSSPPLHPVA
ncbi:unnamed protein product, partial [Closterium sp. NIES-53]